MKIKLELYGASRELSEKNFVLQLNIEKVGYQISNNTKETQRRRKQNQKKEATKEAGRDKRKKHNRKTIQINNN